MVKVVEINSPPKIEDFIRSFGSREGSFILDSAQSNDGLGEWSFFGCEPFEVLSGGARLEDLREWFSRSTVENETKIPFIGGAVGFISYDYGRQLEKVPNLALNDRVVPDIYFGLYDGIAALNLRDGSLYLVALGIKGDADETIEELRRIAETDTNPAACKFTKSDWEWNLTKDQFRDAVGRVKDYIAQGDVYQVNLSRRARCNFEGDPVELYQALRVGNPAPFGAYLNTGELQILSTSPEQFLRKRGSYLETRPIKGTRPRGATEAEDIQQAESLQQSAKDRAELLMIVDLERNDLGRISKFGTVEVSDLYHLEHYAGVIHQIARVHSQMAEGKDVIDCLEALFPGGSITGAPKIRAMEIIEELEPTRRGAYCGSIGYIGFDQNAEFNIAIRTLHVQHGQLDYQVGSGIVWDSEPSAEYEETLDKARAIHDTIEKLCQK